MVLDNISSMLLLRIGILIVIGEILSQGLEHQAIDRQKPCMEIARSTLREKGADLSVADGKLRAWGTATIFQGDTRVATNALKPEGSPAVGTKPARWPTARAPHPSAGANRSRES